MVESFFLIISPGLEKLATAELNQKLDLLRKKTGQDLPLRIVSKIRGGTLIECERDLGFALNHWLKIPTRILLRVDEFRCRDFPKLFNKIRKLPWHNYLRKGPVEFSVSIHQSRMKIKEKVAESMQFALTECEKHQAFRKKFLDVPQTIFVRLNQDTLVVSIDTSGEPLFRRGYKPYTVKAPIRENLAASLLFPMISQNPSGEVIDMMAGSGTIGFEALSYFSPVRSRSFAYQNFPEQVPMDVLVGKQPLIKSTMQVKSFEHDIKNFEALKKNNHIFAEKFGSGLLTEKADVFSSAPNPGAHLFCNPPYDQRLPTQSENLEKEFSEFIKKSEPASVSVVWPGENPPSFGFDWTQSLATSNGGIPITLNFWQNSSGLQ